jgi:hypothetical protein
VFIANHVAYDEEKNEASTKEDKEGPAKAVSFEELHKERFYRKTKRGDEDEKQWDKVGCRR